MKWNFILLLVCCERKRLRPSSVLSPVKSIGLYFPLRNNLYAGKSALVTLYSFANCSFSFSP